MNHGTAQEVYEGKAKILYEGPEPGTLIQYFKDDSAPTVAAPATLEGKGVLNNRLSEFFMAGLNQIGVPTHFIRRINMREQLVRMAEIIPLEVVVRNFAAGPLTSRLGIPEGRSSLARSSNTTTRRQAAVAHGVRGTHRRLQLGQPAGPRRHRGTVPARQRLPVRRDDGRGHPPGGFPDRGSAGSGRATSCA